MIVFIGDFVNESSSKFYKVWENLCSMRDGCSIVVSIWDCGSCDAGSIPASHPFYQNVFKSWCVRRLQ